MMQFFAEGGWGMWPVLIFSVVAVWSAARYAWDLEPARLRFTLVLVVLDAVASLHAMLTDVAQVFWHVQDRARVPDAELTRTVFTGLMESTRPGALAGIAIVLALTLVAVGVHREGHRELGAR